MAATIDATQIRSAQLESASTLRTIVELVRRIMRADVSAIVSFSLLDQTLTWKAASGYHTFVVDDLHPVVRPFAGDIGRRAFAENNVVILEGTTDLAPASFPIHSAEGIQCLAIAPLTVEGRRSGSLLAGYRSAHLFTDDEKGALQDLADIATTVLNNGRLLDQASAAEERFRLVVEAAPSAMVMVNDPGGIALVNVQAEELFGYSRSELLGQPIEMLIPERFRPAHPGHRMIFSQHPTARAMGAGRDLYGRRKDGSEVPIEIGLNPIRTDEGAFVLADIIDISERKKIEDTLRQSEERAQRGKQIWEKTFDAIGEGIIVYDSNGTIIRANVRAAEMLEMEPASVIGMSFTDVFSRMFGQRAAEYYLGGNYGASTVVEVQTEYGRRFLVSISPIREGQESSASVVTWNDVTQLSEIQDQLGRSRRLASVGQLAAGVAHEVNNPLAAITTCAEAVMRDMQQNEVAKELAERQQWNYYLEEIVRQALRCKEITRGLLDLTRQRQAKRTLCDINDVVKQCAKVALQRAGSNVEFSVVLNEDIGEVASDTEMLRQMLDNLLANAIDALDDKPGRILVSTIRDGDRVAIEVADTGQGISSEVLARIFDPFFSTKGPGKGYGLGLALCLTMAESLGGGITVETKEGEGSTFRVWIPRRAE